MSDRIGPIKTTSAPVNQKYGDAAGYDSYMGSWSGALAAPFLHFVALEAPAALLDIGCGTGNLLAAAAALFPRARLVGVDPSATLLQRARARAELTGAELLEGDAESLPFDDKTFDGCLSLLVLQEFADLSAALREMRRVTRRGGIVAACQWDFSRMPVIAALVDAIAALNPEAAVRLATRSPGLLGHESELSKVWAKAGFEDVSADRIKVERRFRDFDELWLPLLTGSTPSTMTLAALPAEKRVVVRSAMSKRFLETQGGFSLISEAFVVRGRA
jgi:ubiquinone/menaquinone biosynthesis C-methylase UbiE